MVGSTAWENVGHVVGMVWRTVGHAVGMTQWRVRGKVGHVVVMRV